MQQYRDLNSGELLQGAYLQGEKYRIISTLGRGGFGITYLAKHELADRDVCIKEFFPKDYYKCDEDSLNLSLSSNGFADMMDKFKEKFLKEARTIARLDNPNIIHIFDVFKENNTAYYVMEYIEGESLHSLIKSRGALTEAMAKAYIRQIASALDAVHSIHINHLDVKPGNVMVRKDNDRAILIDFGLSKQYDDEGNQTSSTPVGISHGFAPMEQYRAGGVSEFSPATDIYSLGATLLYLITGKVPPTASEVAEDGIPELPAEISVGVKLAISKAMEVRRKDRPQSIRDFLNLLEQGAVVVDEGKTEIAMPKANDGNTEIASPIGSAHNVAPTPKATPRAEAATPTPKPASAEHKPVAPKPAPKPNATAKTPAPKVAPTPTPTPKMASATAEEKKSKKRGGCLWIIVLMLVIGGIGVGGWYLFSTKEEPQKEEPITILNLDGYGNMHKIGIEEIDLDNDDNHQFRNLAYLRVSNDGRLYINNIAVSNEYIDYKLANDLDKFFRRNQNIDKWIGGTKVSVRGCYIVLAYDSNVDSNFKSRLESIIADTYEEYRNTIAIEVFHSVFEKLNNSEKRELHDAIPIYVAITSGEVAELKHCVGEAPFKPLPLPQPNTMEDEIAAKQTTQKTTKQTTQQTKPKQQQSSTKKKSEFTPPSEADKMNTDFKVVNNGNKDDFNIDGLFSDKSGEGKTSTDDDIFVTVEQMPTFQGGNLVDFRNWVMQNVTYPPTALENGIQGNVVVQFVIDKDGKITNIKVLQSPDKTLSNAAIAVLEKANTLRNGWKPGMQRGKPVRVAFTLPIRFWIAQ